MASPATIALRKSLPVRREYRFGCSHCEQTSLVPVRFVHVQRDREAKRRKFGPKHEPVFECSCRGRNRQERRAAMSNR